MAVNAAACSSFSIEVEPRAFSSEVKPLPETGFFIANSTSPFGHAMHGEKLNAVAFKLQIRARSTAISDFRAREVGDWLFKFSGVVS
jgi:hypothetical protein